MERINLNFDILDEMTRVLLREVDCGEKCLLIGRCQMDRLQGISNLSV
jgi:hypothetical protein